MAYAINGRKCLASSRIIRFVAWFAFGVILVITAAIYAPTAIGERFRTKQACHDAIAASSGPAAEPRFGYATTTAETLADGTNRFSGRVELMGDSGKMVLRHYHCIAKHGRLVDYGVTPF
jgi:hypothetical protein